MSFDITLQHVILILRAESILWFGASTLHRATPRGHISCSLMNAAGPSHSGMCIQRSTMSSPSQPRPRNQSFPQLPPPRMCCLRHPQPLPSCLPHHPPLPSCHPPHPSRSRLLCATCPLRWKVTPTTRSSCSRLIAADELGTTTVPRLKFIRRQVSSTPAACQCR